MIRWPRVARLDLDIDAWMQCKETVEPRHEQLTCKKWRQQHAQGSAAVAARELRKAAVHRCQQRCHFLEQLVTRGRQLKRTRLAFEQAHSDDIFELFHLVADCG